MILMPLGHVQDMWARSWPALAFRSSCYVVVVAADRRTTLQVRAPDIEQLNGAEQGLRGTLCKNIRSTLEAERVARISQEQQVAAQGGEGSLRMHVRAEKEGTEDPRRIQREGTLGMERAPP